MKAEADMSAPGGPREREAAVARARVFEPMKFVSFSVVGLCSGVVYATIYLVLRRPWAPASANFGALVLATLFNTEANRRWTFAHATVPRIGMHVQAAILFLTTYIFTTGAVSALHLVDRRAGKLTEVAVLTLVSLAMTVLRFVGLARWVHRRVNR